MSCYHQWSFPCVSVFLVEFSESLVKQVCLHSAFVIWFTSSGNTSDEMERARPGCWSRNVIPRSPDACLLAYKGGSWVDPCRLTGWFSVNTWYKPKPLPLGMGAIVSHLLQFQTDKNLSSFLGFPVKHENQREFASVDKKGRTCPSFSANTLLCSCCTYVIVHCCT